MTPPTSASTAASTPSTSKIPESRSQSQVGNMDIQNSQDTFCQAVVLSSCMIAWLSRICMHLAGYSPGFVMICYWAAAGGAQPRRTGSIATGADHTPAGQRTPDGLQSALSVELAGAVLSRAPSQPLTDGMPSALRASISGRSHMFCCTQASQPCLPKALTVSRQSLQIYVAKTCCSDPCLHCLTLTPHSHA